MMDYAFKRNIEIFDKGNHYIIKDKDNNNFIRIYQGEYNLLQTFKDFRTVEELDESELEMFNAFLELGIITDGKSDPKAKVEKKAFNIFDFTLCEFSVKGVLSRFEKLINLMFTKKFKIVCYATLISAITSFFIIYQNHINIFSEDFYYVDTHEMITLYVFMILGIGFHELAHAVTMMHYKENVEKMGIKID